MSELKDYNGLACCSIETNYIRIADKVKRFLLIGVLGTSLSVLTACGSGISGTESTVGSAPTNGGAVINYTDITGDPDIMGQITFTPTTAKPGDIVTMHIPVDADTFFIGVELVGINPGSLVGGSVSSLADYSSYVTVTTTGAQTVDIPITIAAGSGAGDYIPGINICSDDINACAQRSS